MAKPSTTKKAGTRRSKRPVKAAVPAPAPAVKAPEAAPLPPAPTPPEPVVETILEQGGTALSGETAPEAKPADGPAEGAGGGQDPEGPAAPAEPAAAPEQGGQVAAAGEASSALEADAEDLFDELFGGNQGEEIPDDQAAPIAGAGAAADDLEAVVAAPASSDAPVRVMLGRTEGVLYRIPIGVVEALLGEPALDRIAALRGNPLSIQDLQKRMRATDGRCAPTIFTAKGEDPPIIFAGLESIAAAKEIGLATISVVTVHPDDAGEVQAYLAHKRSQAPAETEDDLILRVNAHYE